MFDPLRTRPNKNLYYTHKGQVIRPKNIYMDTFNFQENDYKRYIEYALKNQDVSLAKYTLPLETFETETVENHNIPSIYNYISYNKKNPLGTKWHKATGNLELPGIPETGEGYLASKIGVYENDNTMFQNTMQSEHFFCINNITGNTSSQSFDLETEYCNCPFIIENLGTQLKVTIEYMDTQITLSSSDSTAQQNIAGNSSVNPMTNQVNQLNSVWSRLNHWSVPLPISSTYRTYVHCKKMEFTVPLTSYFGSITILFDSDDQDVRTLSAAVLYVPELTVE